MSVTTDTSDNLDESGRTDRLIALLDQVDGLPETVLLRERSYELLATGDGTAAGHVVDVGCGAGRAVAELAERGIPVTGVDVDDRMIGVARRRFPDRIFRVASAETLPFGDGELGGYRADKVYHGLDNPTLAAVEARRVLAPGGKAVLLGQDWDLVAIDSDDTELIRALVHARADTVPNPWAARRQHSTLVDAGFADVTLEVHVVLMKEHSLVAPIIADMAEAGVTAGVASRDRAEAWLAEQERRGRQGTLLFAWPMFVASGTVPTTAS